MQELSYQDQHNEPPVYVHNVAESYNFDLLIAKEQEELERLLEAQAADGLDNIALYPWQRRFNTEIGRASCRERVSDYV